MHPTAVGAGEVVRGGGRGERTRKRCGEELKGRNNFALSRRQEKCGGYSVLS